MPSFGPFPPGNYIAGTDIAPGFYRGFEGQPIPVIGAESVDVFNGSRAGTYHYIVELGLYLVRVADDAATVRVKTGSLFYIEPADLFNATPGDIIQVFARRRVDEFGNSWEGTEGHVDPLLTRSSPLNIKTATTWLTTNRKPGYPVFVFDGAWRQFKAVGDGSRYRSESIIGYYGEGVDPVPEVGGWIDYTFTGTTSGARSGYLNTAQSTVRVDELNDIAAYTEQVSYTTVDLVTLRNRLLLRGIDPVAATITLVFWIVGTHNDYLSQRDPDDNGGLGYPSTPRPIHFASSDCPVASSGFDTSGTRLSYHVTGTGTRGSDYTTLWTGTPSGTFDGRQLVEVPVTDISAEHLDFTMWLTPERDDPPPGPPLLTPDPESLTNWSASTAAVLPAAVIVETDF